MYHQHQCTSAGRAGQHLSAVALSFCCCPSGPVETYAQASAVLISASRGAQAAVVGAPQRQLSADKSCPPGTQERAWLGSVDSTMAACQAASQATAASSSGPQLQAALLLGHVQPFSQEQDGSHAVSSARRHPSSSLAMLYRLSSPSSGLMSLPAQAVIRPSGSRHLGKRASHP